jgi:transcriptional regulator with XRE-family HTH domain
MPEPTRNPPSRLKVAIVESGLTSAQVAEMIGKSRGQLARWTTGSRDCPKTAQIALAHALERPVEELFPPEPAPEQAAA